MYREDSMKIHHKHVNKKTDENLKNLSWYNLSNRSRVIVIRKLVVLLQLTLSKLARVFHGQAGTVALPGFGWEKMHLVSGEGSQRERGQNSACASVDHAAKGRRVSNTAWTSVTPKPSRGVIHTRFYSKFILTKTIVNKFFSLLCYLAKTHTTSNYQ